MFYSYDILSSKTGPLGAVWSMAHGRKLGKKAVNKIGIVEMCNQILSPDVPHSLRLQGILIGGLAIVFDRQQSYLLEDLQDMFKAVKTATLANVQELVRATVQGGIRGRSGAINANDEYDLIDDGLGVDPMNPAGCFLSFDDIYDAKAAPQASDVLQEISDMFLIPSNNMFESNDQSRSKSHASFKQISSNNLSESDEDSYPVNLKVKPLKNARKDLKLDQKLKVQNGKASADATAGDPRGVRSGTDVSSPAAAAGLLGLIDAGLRLPLASVPDEDDRFEPIDHEDQDLEQYHIRPYHLDREQEQAYDYDVPMQNNEDLYDEDRQRGDLAMNEEEGGAAHDKSRANGVEDEEDSNAASMDDHAKAKKARKAPAKKKASFGFKRSKAIVDDIEGLTIRIKDYREWQSNTADILRPVIEDLSQGAPFEAEMDVLRAELADIGLPLLSVPPIKICAQLSSLYAKAADPSRGEAYQAVEESEEEVVVSKRASKRQKKETSGEDEEVLDDTEGIPLVMAHKNPVRSSSVLSKGDLDMFVIDEQDDVRFDDVEEEEEVRRRDTNSSDHELERLRAVAATPGGGSTDLDGVRMRLHLGTESGLKGLGSKGTNRSQSNSQSLSGLTPEKENKGPKRGGEVEGRKRQVTGPLSPIQDNHQWQDDEVKRPRMNGDGVIEDLMLEESGEIGLGRGSGYGAGLGSSAAAPAYGRPFTQALAVGSDFRLLESSGIEDTQMMSRASMMVVEIIRKRLGQSAPNAPRPFVSFFDLLEGGSKGQLKQAQAIKLFYSLLVIETAGFIKMEQEQSFEDMRIYAGKHM